MYLNLGLPNALGGYDETPEIMSSHLQVHVYEFEYVASK